jgi:predicted outer membrane repeat protein
VISLREAVNAANTLGGSNNIFFNLNGTFTLTGGELGISSNLNIYGNGASFTTVSGNSASRVFNISSGNVLLSGLTIANGQALGDGGGILNRGTLTVQFCTFSGNSAIFGGGIANSGVLNAVGAVFTNNRANNGGGLYTTNEAVVDFCTFTNNQANDDGGGLYASGVLNLGNSYFQNNRASAEGGGLYLTGSNAKVSLSTFLSNSASEGGAIGLGDSSSTNTLLVTDSVLRFNSATSQGGGIFAGPGDQVTIRRSRVRQNTAPVGVDLFGAYISEGFNLIGKGGGFTGIINGVNGDVILVP